MKAAVMEKKLQALIEQKILEWQQEDIYAISLYVFDEEDDPCRPAAVLGYNTETQVQRSASQASDEQEARWNYAFWLQNEEICWGMDDTAGEVRQWIALQGLENREEDISEAFEEMLTGIVRDIHASGMLESKFGRELPILIHGLEYDRETARRNLEANGDALDGDFLVFCGQGQGKTMPCKGFSQKADIPWPLKEVLTQYELAMNVGADGVYIYDGDDDVRKKL